MEHKKLIFLQWREVETKYRKLHEVLLSNFLITTFSLFYQPS